MENELTAFTECVIDKPRKLTKKDLKKEFKHLGRAMIFNFVLQIVVAALLGAVIAQIAINSIHIDMNLLMITTVMVTLFFADTIPFFLCAHQLKIKIRTYFEKPALSLQEMIRWFFIIMAIVAVFNLLTTALMSFFPDIQFQQSGLEGIETTNWTTLIFSFITIAIIAPIFEEIAFRGLCLHVFNQYGTRFAIIASSMLFALLHGNVIQGIFAFGLGILLSLITLKAKSIRPAIFIHFANNSIALIPSVWVIYALFAIFILCGLILYFKNTSIFKLDEVVADHRFCWDALMATPSILIIVILHILMIITTTIFWFI